MRVLNTEQMKIVEQRASDNGMGFLRLMENAGSACTRIIKSKYLKSDIDIHRITIVCGNGKNGGDGFVIARKLCELNCQVNVVLANGQPRDNESIEMYKKINDLQVNIIRYGLEDNSALEAINKAGIIIDAVFGTGFYGCPNEELSVLFKMINSVNAFKVAIDIPSGVTCNTGEVFGECIKADITIAVSALKPAHIFLPGVQFCGEIITADIGIPELYYKEIGEERIYSLNEDEIKQSFIPISPFANKGNFGRVLSVCGSKKMQGAAVLAAKGAVLSGAGLVTAAFPDCAYNAIGSKLTEPLLLPLNSNEEGTISASAISKIFETAKKADAILIGCGIGLNRDTREIVKEVIMNTSCPIVIDADGINAICHDKDLLKKSKNTIVLTPHLGEMSRLTNINIDRILEKRIDIARCFANEFGIILVLKGANTVIAEPDTTDVYINTTGNSGMATGGSGDLLAGIIASFIAQGMTVGNAAKAAVYIHGLTGDITAKRLSKRGLTPTACIEDLPSVMSRFEN